VLEGVAITLLVAVLAAVLAVSLIRREGEGLRRRSRRYRELELEGIEELRTRDMAYPEEPAVDGVWMREPDGRPADANRVLRKELERARRHTRRARSARSRSRSATRGKGAECLL
jgi:hypothetical protein